MLANPKELKCIEITASVIEKDIFQKAGELKDSINPLLNLRRYCLKLRGTESWVVLDRKMIFRTLLGQVLFFLIYPVVFMNHFITLAFFSTKDKKVKKKEIQGLMKKCKISYDVSENKSFLQLWSDKGLRDYGMAHMDKGPYSYKDKYFCLSEWVKILYDEKL